MLDQIATLAPGLLPCYMSLMGEPRIRAADDRRERHRAGACIHHGRLTLRTGIPLPVLRDHSRRPRWGLPQIPAQHAWMA